MIGCRYCRNATAYPEVETKMLDGVCYEQFVSVRLNCPLYRISDITESVMRNECGNYRPMSADKIPVEKERPK